jgi:hypothetical protein
MNLSSSAIIKSAAFSLVAIASVAITHNPVSARPLGTNSSYIGAGISTGLTTGSTTAEQSHAGGSISGRFAVPKSNFSARGGLVFNNKLTAVTPKVTYDVAVAPSTNVYAGVGYNFVTESGVKTPLGDKSAPVLTIGAESELANNIMIYGSADLGINSYSNTNNQALALQGGLGFRF